MKHVYTLMGLFICICSNIVAQSLPVDSLESKGKDPYLFYQNRSALTLNIGTTGLGLEFAKNLDRHFNVKIRGTYFSNNNPSTTERYDDHNINIFSQVDIANIDLIAEYLPFPRSRFKLNAGLGYFITLDPSATVAYDGEISYGEIVLTKEDIGQVLVDLSWKGLAPYVGIGFGRSVPSKPIGFGIDLGTYYVGSPDVSVVGTNLLSNNSEEEITLNDNMEGYQWMPFLNFGLSVKL